MKAAIAGGGIAGLATAVALRNEGWDVVIYEKTANMDPGPGNAFSMGANGLRLLEHWGLDLEELKVGTFMQERVFNAATGELLRRIDHSWAKSVTGYDWIDVSRTRLYDSLLGLARRTPEGKTPITIYAGLGVVSVDPENGTLKTQLSEMETADVIIVADGVYSKLIYTIDPQASPLIGPTTAFRMILDRDAVLEDEVIGKIWKNEEPGFVLFKPKDPDTVWLVPPETDGRLFSLLLHPYIEAKNGSETRWDAEASLSELRELTTEFSGPSKRLVPYVRGITRWTLSTREPIARFAKGKAAAIGDAAHPHVPSHGQGACSAMEDAASLAVFLSDSKVKDVPMEIRLQKWNEFRYGRASTVQAISINGMRPLEDILDKIRNRIGYKGPLPESVDYHARPVQTFFFLYDVRKEAKAFVDREF